MKRPIIGITMGDPAGNGAEISVKALAEKSVYERCCPLIIGDARCMEKAVKAGKGHGRANPDSSGETDRGCTVSIWPDRCI